MISFEKKTSKARSSIVLLPIDKIWEIYAYIARYGRQSWKDIDDFKIEEGFMFFDAISSIISKESEEVRKD